MIILATKMHPASCGDTKKKVVRLDMKKINAADTLSLSIPERIQLIYLTMKGMKSRKEINKK